MCYEDVLIVENLETGLEEYISDVKSNFYFSPAQRQIFIIFFKLNFIMSDLEFLAMIIYDFT